MLSALYVALLDTSGNTHTEHRGFIEFNEDMQKLKNILYINQKLSSQVYKLQTISIAFQLKLLQSCNVQLLLYDRMYVC